ncbi:hypothetical protein Purlil1_12488 [Purpureocillium lilacinum]|uniref:Uncharacterized protein n=1 Tax=Purpureocillium lilacinum TaxID=33203 RepID=A0ABR0BGQ7_PURLI|nr:hypothetical protein Purlil1_12488 [Purpureocillium lilacinum]
MNGGRASWNWAMLSVTVHRFVSLHRATVLRVSDIHGIIHVHGRVRQQGEPTVPAQGTVGVKSITGIAQDAARWLSVKVPEGCTVFCRPPARSNRSRVHHTLPGSHVGHHEPDLERECTARRQPASLTVRLTNHNRPADRMANPIGLYTSGNEDAIGAAKEDTITVYSTYILYARGPVECRAPELQERQSVRAKRSDRLQPQALSASRAGVGFRTRTTACCFVQVTPLLEKEAGGFTPNHAPIHAPSLECGSRLRVLFSADALTRPRTGKTRTVTVSTESVDN